MMVLLLRSYNSFFLGHKKWGSLSRPCYSASYSPAAHTTTVLQIVYRAVTEAVKFLHHDLLEHVQISDHNIRVLSNIISVGYWMTEFYIYFIFNFYMTISKQIIRPYDNDMNSSIIWEITAWIMYYKENNCMRQSPQLFNTLYSGIVEKSLIFRQTLSHISVCYKWDWNACTAQMLNICL